jgi:hypothetical protein
MPRTAGDDARAQRVADIREARGESQPRFAQSLVTALEQLKYTPETSYDGAVISKIETGMRGLTFEEADAIAMLDPKHRGREWLVGWSPAPKQKRQRTPNGHAEETPEPLHIQRARKIQPRVSRPARPKDEPRRGNER